MEVILNDNQEQKYIQGSRAAWRQMLQLSLANLGYPDQEVQKTSWILEREGIIAQLRDVCDSFGDNDWDDTLNLGDVIEKHLGRHLSSSENLE